MPQRHRLHRAVVNTQSPLPKTETCVFATRQPVPNTSARFKKTRRRLFVTPRRVLVTGTALKLTRSRVVLRQVPVAIRRACFILSRRRVSKTRLRVPETVICVLAGLPPQKAAPGWAATQLSEPVGAASFFAASAASAALRSR